MFRHEMYPRPVYDLRENDIPAATAAGHHTRRVNRTSGTPPSRNFHPPVGGVPPLVLNDVVNGAVIRNPVSEAEL